MDWWLASFFLGAIFSLFLPVVPDLFVLFLLLLLSVILFYYPLNLRKAFRPLRSSSGLVFGACWMLFNAFNYQHLWQKSNLSAENLSNEAQWVKGEILNLHSPSENKDPKLTTNASTNSRLRFNIKTTHINNQRHGAIA